MSHRLRFDQGGAVRVVADALPVVHALTALRQPTRAFSLLRISREGAAAVLPVGPSPVTVGARAFTPCAYNGAPLRDRPPPGAPPGAVGPLAPPVTLDVVALDTLPIGSAVLAPAGGAPGSAWVRAYVVGNATQVRGELTAAVIQGASLALGRRATWVPAADVGGGAGAAIFAGARVTNGGAFNTAPLVALDAFLPSGGVRFRGSDGSTFEAPGLGMLESFDLPLPDQAGRVWIIEAADRATTDPDPDPGAGFVCVHPSFME